MQKKALHLPGLNGLRAIAALAVVVSHITISLKEFHLNAFILGSNADGSPKGLDMAGYGVSIFFSLSGFLITYLLLLEKKEADINIPKFYIRRILRIWPLYYLYLAICVIVMIVAGMHINTGSLLLYIFYAANVPFILSATLPFVYHYWSLGVEEQFYLFWPWVVKKAGSRLNLITLSAIVGLIGLKLILRYTLGDQSLWYQTINVTRFHSMLIGAFGAMLFYIEAPIIKFLTSKVVQFAAWLIMLTILLNRFHVASVLDNEFVSVVGLILILGQVTLKNRLINLEIGLFDFLGKISYGIYVIHPLVIYFLAKCIGNIEIGMLPKYVIVYSGVISLTILLAYLSYNYYEKRFLRLKDRYAVIKTAAAKQ